MKKKWMIVLFCSICVVSLVLFIVFNFSFLKKDYSFYVQKYASEYNLDEALIYAVIKAESDFQDNAVSPSGALGLMQMIPRTAEWIASEFGEEYDKEKMFLPETNIKYGCFYLRYLFDKFKNQDVVVCAYNAGEGIVKNWLDENGNLIEDKISYSETKIYLERVRNFFEYYEKYK